MKLIVFFALVTLLLFSFYACKEKNNPITPIHDATNVPPSVLSSLTISIIGGNYSNSPNKDTTFIAEGDYIILSLLPKDEKGYAINASISYDLSPAIGWVELGPNQLKITVDSLPNGMWQKPFNFKAKATRDSIIVQSDTIYCAIVYNYFTGSFTINRTFFGGNQAFQVTAKQSGKYVTWLYPICTGTLDSNQVHLAEPNGTGKYFVGYIYKGQIINRTLVQGYCCYTDLAVLIDGSYSAVRN
jgi:hypothetical protein